MALLKIIFSPTGGTKKVTDILAEEISSDAVTVSLMGNAFEQDIKIDREDICLIAVPSFGGRVPMPAVERLCKLQGNGAKAILIVTYGNRAYEDTMIELKDIAEKSGFCCIAAVAAVTEHSIMPSFGSGRPDIKDQEELKKFGRKIAEKLENHQEFSQLSVPGNSRYREFGGLPFSPKASSACTGCGACAKVCPTGAIDPENPKKTDTGKCITCMGCVSVCTKST